MEGLSAEVPIYSGYNCALRKEEVRPGLVQNKRKKKRKKKNEKKKKKRETNTLTQ